MVVGATSCWTVDAERTDAGTGLRVPVRLQCSWVVATTGYYRYDRGYTPEFTGLDRYRGEFVHAQECPSDLEVDGRRVAVIGSGATAATLIPALAERGAHVTMVQRSPSYYASLPRQDPIADVFRKHLSAARGAAVDARQEPGDGRAVLPPLPVAARRDEARARRTTSRAGCPKGSTSLATSRRRTGRGISACASCPAAISSRSSPTGSVDVVTGAIDTFTERGLRLATGEEIEADIVIAATGLEVLALGDVEVVVDGEVMPPGSRLVYKSVMLSDVPNLAYVFGYANASWTLKVDLAAAWIARAIAYMRSTGATKAVATAPIEDMPTRPMLDLAAGYVKRAEGRFPRQGTGVWSVPSYRTDARRLLKDPIDDGILRFSSAPVREPTVTRSTVTRRRPTTRPPADRHACSAELHGRPRGRRAK